MLHKTRAAHDHEYEEKDARHPDQARVPELVQLVLQRQREQHRAADDAEERGLVDQEADDPGVLLRVDVSGGGKLPKCNLAGEISEGGPF